MVAVVDAAGCQVYVLEEDDEDVKALGHRGPKGPGQSLATRSGAVGGVVQFPDGAKATIKSAIIVTDHRRQSRTAQGKRAKHITTARAKESSRQHQAKLSIRRNGNALAAVAA